jgi:hypothetical protein
MGDDGMSGLALAIALACIGIVATGLALFFFIGRNLGRRFKLGRGGRLLTGIVGAVLGLGLGLLAVTATFYESQWMPPPQVTFKLPADFAHRWVFLLEDPSSRRELVWRGSEWVPFQGMTAETDMPANGVLRLRSLGPLSGRADTSVIWSDGAVMQGAGGGPGTPELKATAYVVFQHGEGTDPFPATQEELVRLIREREASGP